MTRIAIIGAGNVGGALGGAWAKKAGHEILFGVRDPKAEKVQTLLRSTGPKARALSPADAAAAAAVIVLSTPWPATEAAIRSMGDLKGKIVLDATNPLTRGPDGIGLEIGHAISGGEKVQGWAAGASVYKTLNTTGFGNMANPAFGNAKAVMFVAGDDAARKPTVLNLVSDLGFETIDAGPLRNARLLEAHAMLWIDLALVRGQGRDWAFGILRR
ncbi:MAG TPA: NAD(P)-binding domain-containing protein [Pseudolabrys sp.]|nr:NAD(P)-binding domain-containing protein [Pseudolabrys sp.]